MKKYITVVSILLVVAAVSFGTPIPNGSFTACTPNASNNCVFADTENSKFLLTGDTSLDAGPLPVVESNGSAHGPQRRREQPMGGTRAPLATVTDSPTQYTSTRPQIPW